MRTGARLFLRRYRFSDPVPAHGPWGASVPPPRNVIRMARAFDGRTATLGDAVRRLMSFGAADGGRLNRNYFTLTFARGCLLLHYRRPERRGPGPEHCWRILRAEAAEESSTK